MNEAEVTTEELRELIREGHGMVKDLTQTMRAAKAVITEMHKAVEEAQDAPQQETEKVIRQTVETALTKLADEMATLTNQATEFVSEEIYSRFDTLMSTILGIDEARGVSIPSLLRAQVKPKIDIEALERLGDPIARDLRKKS